MIYITAQALDFYKKLYFVSHECGQAVAIKRKIFISLEPPLSLIYSIAVSYA